MFWAYRAEKELWNAGCLVHKKGSILACDGVDWPFFCVVLAYFKGNRGVAKLLSSCLLDHKETDVGAEAHVELLLFVLHFHVEEVLLVKFC